MSRCLLDTHVLLWATSAPERLRPATTRLLVAKDHDLVISAISLAEMAIKASIGKLDLGRDVATAGAELQQRWSATILPFNEIHAAAPEHLPLHHRDPFDRMLIAQAMTEGFTLVSADDSFAAYPIDLHDA